MQLWTSHQCSGESCNIGDYVTWGSSKPNLLQPFKPLSQSGVICFKSRHKGETLLLWSWYLSKDISQRTFSISSKTLRYSVQDMKTILPNPNMLAPVSDCGFQIWDNLFLGLMHHPALMYVGWYPEWRNYEDNTGVRTRSDKAWTWDSRYPVQEKHSKALFKETEWRNYFQEETWSCQLLKCCQQTKRKAEVHKKNGWLQGPGHSGHRRNRVQGLWQRISLEWMKNLSCYWNKK